MQIKKLSWKNIRVPAAGVLLFSVLTAIIVPLYIDSIKHPAVSVSGIISETSPILIIDPGHGGLDGGAVAADGTKESTLNLEIAFRMDQLAKMFGLATILTRKTEELEYPDADATVHAKKVWDQKNRVELINRFRDGVLISIHQNRFPDSRPRGSQVLYAKNSGSRELAEITHCNLISLLNPENRRVEAPISDSIFLMKQICCPAILVECGFLSNPSEAEKLKSAQYQKSLAVVLLGSYLEYVQL